MSAQLRPEAAAPPRAAQARPTRRGEPGEVAFDRWLKRELGRLYDEALEEPVPDELARLLDEQNPPRPNRSDKGGSKP